MYAHKSIKRFSLDGEIYDDSHIIRLKEQYYSMIVAGMRFNFEISIYGVYVGKRTAECISGIDKNKPVMATSTQKIKSEEVC
jgi:hypothetical protein